MYAVEEITGAGNARRNYKNQHRIVKGVRKQANVILQ